LLLLLLRSAHCSVIYSSMLQPRWRPRTGGPLCCCPRTKPTPLCTAASSDPILLLLLLLLY
jgi:hypothetical protein